MLPAARSEKFKKAGVPLRSLSIPRGSATLYPLCLRGVGKKRARLENERLSFKQKDEVINRQFLGR